MQQQASIALIRHPHRLESEWLAYWNDQRQHFAFVTAVRLQNESWRECLDRELAWILQLRRGKDYLISSMARLHFEETVFDSATGHETEIAVEFFVVDPYGKNGRAAFEAQSFVRWTANQELLDGHTADGAVIDPWLVALLRKADVLTKCFPDRDHD